MRQITRRSFGHIIVFAILMSGPPPAYAQTADRPSGGRLELTSVAGGDRLVSVQDEKLETWIAALSETVGHPLIVLGNISAETAVLEKANGKDVRQGMKVLADAVRGEWEKYGDFYLLFPTQMERHSAKPVSRAKRYPELKRKIDAVHSSSTFVTTLRKLGKPCRIPLFFVGLTAPVPARNRSLLRCTIAAEGRTLDELMQALTVVTGDPWERFGNAHVLSLTGEPMTGDERSRMSSTLASINFTLSLSPLQEQQLRTPEGLHLGQMSPQQQSYLIAGTRSLHAGKGVDPRGFVLSRMSRKAEGWSDFIDVALRNPDGSLQPIGSIRAPQ